VSNTRIFSSGTPPRILFAAIVLATLLVLSGCWVTTINPLYEGGGLDDFLTKDPDVVFDPSLVGSWSVTDESRCTTTLTFAADSGTYDLRSLYHGEGCQDASRQELQDARLVKLDTHYFLDVSAMPNDVCDMCMRKHEIFMLKIDKDALSLTPIDSDWLKEAIEAKVVTLPTLANDTDTLTASSKDLKDFCRKYADDNTVFKPESTGTFERNPVRMAGPS
jgi:hypothetical protein